MALLASDLVPYAAALMPADDTSPVGGAIDPTLRVVFADVRADTPQVVSNNAGDATQTLTISVLNATGTLISQTVALAGTQPVSLNTLSGFNRVESARLSAICSGTVTIQLASNQVPIAVIPPGELGFVRLFQSALPSISLQKTYYQKFFWKNTGNADLYAPSVLLDDPRGVLAHCLAALQNDTTQNVNRLTPPAAASLAAPALFDATIRDVPPTISTASALLAPGAAIGVWFALTLAPGAAPLREAPVSTLIGSALAT